MVTEFPPEKPRYKRLASAAAQAVLILITIGLIIAIWLPALVGPSEEKQKRDARSWLRSMR